MTHERTWRDNPLILLGQGILGLGAIVGAVLVVLWLASALFGPTTVQSFTTGEDPSDTHQDYVDGYTDHLLEQNR